MTGLYHPRRCTSWVYDQRTGSWSRCQTIVLWPADAGEPVLCVGCYDRLVDSEAYPNPAGWTADPRSQPERGH